MANEPNKIPVYVAFQGGGMLGIAHLGAWQEISKNFDIVGTAGTSSGSIIAALCAIGFSPEDLVQKQKINWADFVDGKSALRLLIESFLRGLFGLGACSNGNRFLKWFKDKIKERHSNNSTFTFDDLVKSTKIYLEIVACNLKDPDRAPVVFSTEKNSHTAISEAVRASISIPLVFEPVSVGNWELVDGGFKVNFPIISLYKKAKRENRILIGVRFKNPQDYLNPLSSRQVLLRSLKLMISSGNQIPDEIENDENYVDIEIDASGFNPLNFTMDEYQKDKLYNKGRYVAEQKLSKLLQRLQEVESAMQAKLPLNARKSIDEARQWLDKEAQRKVEDYCESTLKLEKFNSLKLSMTESQIEDLISEISNYLRRVSSSLLRQDYNLLRNRLREVSVHNVELYYEVLDCVKRDIPEYMNPATKSYIEEGIVCLRQSIYEQSRSW